EEARIIAPAVDQLIRDGMDVAGPFPADTLMARAVQGSYDGVVAMYHDQGHIAFKLVRMFSAVNITLGLPIIRTSVAHGTAFDIAWKGLAETEGLLSAVRTCGILCETRPDL
ncbi:MAG TPA: 4-hydroxythreonine-4-phosphate dehydrogenase PdxA, partial [Pirellulaceae bacterium]